MAIKIGVADHIDSDTVHSGMVKSKTRLGLNVRRCLYSASSSKVPDVFRSVHLTPHSDRLDHNT